MPRATSSAIISSKPAVTGAHSPATRRAPRAVKIIPAEQKGVLARARLGRWGE